MMNGATRRAEMTLGTWLVETARLLIAQEWMTRVPAVQSAPDRAVQDASHVPSLPDLAPLIRELLALANAHGCHKVAARARKVLLAGLDAHLPPSPQRGQHNHRFSYKVQL